MTNEQKEMVDYAFDKALQYATIGVAAVAGFFFGGFFIGMVAYSIVGWAVRTFPGIGMWLWG